MVMAVVLINVETGETSRIAEELANIPGISEVYSACQLTVLQDTHQYRSQKSDQQQNRHQ